MSDTPFESEDGRPSDPLVALRAEVDQGMALAPEVARMCRANYDSFIAEGFTESQATYLTAAQLNGQPGTPR